MKSSLLDALVKLSGSKSGLVESDGDEYVQWPLKAGDRRSARAKAAYARAKRAIARSKANRPPSRYTPKKLWPRVGRRGSQAPPGLSVLDRIIVEMKPGAWYGRSDLAAL